MANPVHQFVIKPIIPLEVGGVDLSFTNSSLWMVLALVSAFTLFSLGSGKKQMIPGRLQNVSEMIYEFVANMVRENIGSEGRAYFPFIFSLFIFILMGNTLGLIPTSFTFTSHIVVTFALALVVILAVTIFGFVRNGLGFLQLFAPSSVPWPLLFLIVPLELISFLIRPITLSLRLFANMMVGHMILKVFAGFCTMLLGAGAAWSLLSIAPVTLNVAVYALELLVAVLHAYIFSVLACTYLKDTVDLHH